MPNIAGDTAANEDKSRLGTGQHPSWDPAEFEGDGPGHDRDEGSFDGAAKACHDRVLGRNNGPLTPSQKDY